MKSKISSRVFEWLLADWSGHADHPDRIFPSLQNADFDELADQLYAAIRNAGAARELIEQRR